MQEAEDGSASKGNGGKRAGSKALIWEATTPPPPVPEAETLSASQGTDGSVPVPKARLGADHAHACVRETDDFSESSARARRQCRRVHLSPSRGTRGLTRHFAVPRGRDRASPTFPRTRRDGIVMRTSLCALKKVPDHRLWSLRVKLPQLGNAHVSAYERAASAVQ